MVTPPVSPSSHHRQSSSISNYSPSRRQSQALSRTSSNTCSPTTSRLGSSHGPGGDSLAQEFAEMDGEGLGSLADELGGWSGEEEEEDDEDADGLKNREGLLSRREGEVERDSGIDVASSPSSQNGSVKLLSPASNSTTSSKKKESPRRRTVTYDGSEYGSESDLEQTELVSASLEARLSVVEALARRGIEENGSEGDRIVTRLTDALQDLGGQSGIEAGTTRLATAYAALSTHLNHQTRILSQLTSTLLSPLAPPLPIDMIEDIIPHIKDILLSIPSISPVQQPPYSLHSLTTHTTDLIQSLNYLSDTLHVNRQSTTVAGRRLRGVKDALREWRMEMERCDESVRWLERGKWDGRLEGRECAAVCDEVLGGFEEVCVAWRERLCQGLEAGSVAAG